MKTVSDYIALGILSTVPFVFEINISLQTAVEFIDMGSILFESAQIIIFKMTIANKIRRYKPCQFQ